MHGLLCCNSYIKIIVIRGGMDVSVVVPAYNEEGNIVLLHERLVDVLNACSLVDSYEIIFVDDGSRDGTLSAMRSLDSGSVVVVSLKRNRGKSFAEFSGYSHVRYPVIITMDGDLQNDARDIPLLLEKIKEGFDFVQGCRVRRRDSFVRRVSSRVANSVRRSVLGDSLRDTGCGFRAFRKSCVDSFTYFDGMHRFLAALALKEGFRVIEVPVSHNARMRGTSKYGVLNRIFASTKDLIRIRRMYKR